MEYKGYGISLNESTGEFTLVVEGEDYFTSTNLVEVKTVVDKLVKKTFKKIPAYILGAIGWFDFDEGNITYTEVEITSIDPKGDIWIADKRKNREKHRGEIFERSVKNLEILKEIKKNKDDVAAIEEIMGNLKKKLEPIKLPKRKEDD